MISVSEAMKTVVSHASPVPGEVIPIEQANGRVLAEDIIARTTQPGANSSAMDGYAIRSRDLAVGSIFKVVGEAPAGKPFDGVVGKLEAVRVFTGSVIPADCDQVVIQEDALITERGVSFKAPASLGRHIRKSGVDFTAGDVLLNQGTRLAAHALTATAAANVAQVLVRRKPRIGILATGDELKRPGSVLQRGDVVCSTSTGLAARVEEWGCVGVDLGIASDQKTDIMRIIADARDLDVLVPLGGASVGDHDHAKDAFAESGLSLIFSKIAVQPGKPTWFGTLGNSLVLGLPGNPASALVCAELFLKPLIYRLSGQLARDAHHWRSARTLTRLKANGAREQFLRAKLQYDAEGRAVVAPALNQDSSLIRPFLERPVLLHREMQAPVADEGSIVQCLLLDN